MIDYFDTFIKKYGMVKRARGFYLYTEKGIRVLDLALDNSRSILGRRTHEIKLTFKQKLDKGMLGFFPSFASRQLISTCKSFFPNHSVRWYSNYEKALNEAKKVQTEVKVFRPFSGIDSKDFLKSESSFLFFPPFATNTTLVFFKEITQEIANSDMIPQLDLSSIIKGFYSIRKAESIYTESLFSNPILQELKSFFDVKGIYLYRKKEYSESEVSKMFEVFLQNKVLISPNIEYPSIFPVLQHYTELKNAIKHLKDSL